MKKVQELSGAELEVMQILWLVSSLINCAREVGANVHIYCKP